MNICSYEYVTHAILSLLLHYICILMSYKDHIFSALIMWCYKSTYVFSGCSYETVIFPGLIHCQKLSLAEFCFKYLVVDYLKSMNILSYC